MLGEAAVSDAELAVLKERADEVRERFTITTKTGKQKLHYAWSKLTVPQMANESPETGKYHLVGYRDTLPHVHANYGGIEQRLKIVGDSICFEDQTSTKVDDQVLTAAHAILLRVLDLQVQHFKLDGLRGEVASCVQDHGAVWKKG